MSRTHSPEPPLSGLTVVELGERVAVPFASRLLADLGARVIKLERDPDGDPSRRWGPFPAGAEGDGEKSGLFAYLNRGKLSVTHPEQPALSIEAIRAASGAPEVILADPSYLGPRLGEGVAALREEFPDAVLVTITPFGTSGPYASYRAYDSTISAAGGISYGIGERDGAPLPLPFTQCDYQAAMCAAIATLMAVFARGGGAPGQHIDVSIHEVMASLHSGYFLPRYIFGGMVGRRAGRDGGAMPYPATVLPCKDGLVALLAPKIGQWRRFLSLLGDPAWAREPRYRDRRAMQWEYKAEVDALLEPWFAQHTKAELVDLFCAHQIPFAPLLSGADLEASEHLLHRRAIASQELPGGGAFTAPTVPYRFSRSPVVVGRAPRLGEHDARGSTGAKRPEHDAESVPSTGAGPLAGVTVLDLGTAWAGGIAGRILGDFGADVIKVESWSHMDGSRMGRPIMVDDAAGGDSGAWPDLQPGFHVHGRSKRSVCLDLRTAKGRELLLRLAAKADVLVHNFPPRVLAKLGLAAEQLHAVNPRLIVAGQSVAGEDGPLSAYTGYANTVSALGAQALAVGYEGQEPIGMFEGIYCDVQSALMTVFAAVAALIERRFSGRGQSADVSQWEATLALAAEALIEYSITGALRQSEGYRSPDLVPQGSYRTADPADYDDFSWLSIAVGSQAEWQALLAELGPGFAPVEGAEHWTLHERRQHRAQIDEAISRWAAGQDSHEAQQRLQARGVAAFRVCTVADVFVDEQLLHRGSFVDVEHPLVGIEPMPGLPWQMSATPGAVSRRAPLLGEHSEEVLASLAGVSAQQFAELVREGVVEVGPPVSAAAH